MGPNWPQGGKLFFTAVTFILAGCSSDSGTSIDALLGHFNSQPILTSVPDQNISHGDLLKIDVNNIKDGTPGTDKDMSYTCTFDGDIDGAVEDGQPCTSIPQSTVTFDTATGVLEWTPQTGLLGKYEVKINGRNSEGSYDEIFTVSVRLKFNGIALYTAITGTSVTATWTPNTAAISYQVFKLNTVTGQYEYLTSIAGGATSGITVTGLSPNTPYTFRVQAVDALGNLDGNVVSRSFTTTELVKFQLTPATVSGPAGTAIPITLRAFNADGSPQTIGGLPITPQIQSGTSSGTFSSVTDNNDGTYSFTFTPTIVGTPALIEVSTNTTFFLENTADVTVVPGPPSSTNSSISVSSSTVTSGQNVTISATVRDAYNNPIASGSTIAFSGTGGNSTGAIGAVNNQGSGNYSASYTGIVAGTAQTLTVSVNGTQLTPTASIQVLPGTPVSANSTLTISSSTITSGSTATVTATLRDINNNPVPSGILVTFNKSGGTSSGSYSAVVNGGAGVYTTTYEGIVAGTPQTLTVSVDGVTLTPTVTVQVIPGAAVLANSSLTISAPTVSSGQFVTATATLKDANANPIESGVTVTFSATGGTSTGTFAAVTNQGGGVYNVRYTGVAAGTAQTLSVLIDGAALGHTVNVTVLPGSPSSTTSTISVSAATVMSGDTVTVTGTLRDDNGNTISSGYLVGFSKSGGTSTGNFAAVTNQGSGVYTTTYEGLVAGSAQTLGITVDGLPLGPTTTVSVLPGTPNSLLSTLTVTANQVVSSQSVTFTATIRDSQSNPISSGIVVSFDKVGGTSTGTFGTVMNQGGGIYTVTYTGVTAGTAQTVQSNVNAAGFGPTQNIEVLVGPPIAATSSFTITSSPVTSGSTALFSATLRDVNNNPITNQFTISFDAVGGSSTGDFGTLNNAGNGTFTITYEGLNAGTAQTARVLADGLPISGLSQTIQVVPGPVDPANSLFTIGSATVQSGTSTNFTINIRDANGNAINGATVTFNKTVGVSDGNITTPATFTANGNYSASYTATTQGAAQTITLVVNGTPIPAMTVSASVTAGPPALMAFTQPANPRNSIDCNGPYTVTLKDAANNTTSSLTPITIDLSSTPADAITDTLFSDSSCLTPLTQLDYAPLVSTATFYYKSYVPQTFTLNFDAPGSITDDSISIMNIPVISWIGTASSATMNGSGSGVTGNDGGPGFIEPLSTLVQGDYLYVADYIANRISKYNIATNTFVGWIGHASSLDGFSAGCTGISIGELTPTWCTGGRSLTGTTTLINGPRGLASDGTYLYMASQHRVLRFRLDNGAFQGWIGRIAGTAPSAPASCVAAGTNTMTPTWCYDGVHGSGNTDGAFNTASDIHIRGTKMYVTDQSNHRVQKWDLDGTYEGWFGQVGASSPTSPASCVGTPQGDPTPDWCIGGTSQSASRFNISCCNPVVQAPKEGFSGPQAISSDASYLYIGDTGNRRIVRINNIAAPAFAGWIGRLHRGGTSSGGNYPTSPPMNGDSYTSTWVMGGTTHENSNSNGFGQIYGLVAENGYLYFVDHYNRIVRLDASDGQDFRWIGRASASPSGGFVGCSSTPVSGVTPGWCTGGSANRVGNTNSAFHTPYSISLSSTHMYVADRYNYRVQRVKKDTGEFDGWIGAAQVQATRWRRTPASFNSALGYDDHSFGTVTNWNGIALNDLFMFVTDPGWHRIKKINRKDGSLVGYIGQIGTYAPTGPENCLGYTSGMTPDWCVGGGRMGSGNGIHGYNNPYGVTADNTYIYIANFSNERIDRVRISDALYMGWIGKINAVPTDGISACTNASTNDITPDWCIGGTAKAGNELGGLNGPRNLVYDFATSKLYASDNGKLMRINPADGQVEAMIGHVSTAGTGCSVAGAAAAAWCGSGAVGGTGSNNYGTFNDPTSFAITSNYIYVADSNNHRIHRVDKSTGAPAGFIARMNNGTNLNVSGTGEACAGLGAPYPKVTPGWCYANNVGNGLNTTTGSEEGAFNSPRGIHADANYLYIADFNNHRIQRINIVTGAPAGWKGYIESIAGMSDSDCIAAGVGGVTPKWCTGGLSGPGKKLGSFDGPLGLDGDANYLYVFDSNNNRIQTIPKN